MRPKLKGDNDVPIMMCAYDELRFKHLVQLLSIIHTESPKYVLTYAVDFDILYLFLSQDTDWPVTIVGGSQPW